MAKTWIEVCLISARGLQRRSSSLWKLQWFAVGWIDSGDKYCTKIDASGNGNPVWKTKFSTDVDSKESGFQDLVLHVEVYSRDPIFLRERFLGAATVVLKEFLQKHVSGSAEISKPVEETGSFQIRKRNSNKCAGFLDISIRVSEERDEPDPSSADGLQNFNIMKRSGGINLATGHGSSQNIVYARGQSCPAAGGAASYLTHTALLPWQQTPNMAYQPTYISRTENPRPSYINMPVAPQGCGHGGPGFGMGLGVGALAAGAAIFGDDFLAGFGSSNDLRSASLTISADPPL